MDAKVRGYSFTDDWFSPYIPVFEKYVGPLAGSPCAILEIGAYEGRATTWMAENVLTHPDARLDALDIRVGESLRGNVEKTGRAHQITLHEGMSRNALRRLPLGHYDFIYVDASHQTIDVLEDAVAAFRLAKIGAVIAFDDCEWDAPPWNKFGVPKPAIDAFLSMYAHPDRYRPLVEILEQGWQVWVRKVEDNAY
jgi:predicted O-methyltransferase YrrM